MICSLHATRAIGVHKPKLHLTVAVGIHECDASVGEPCIAALAFGRVGYPFGFGARSIERKKIEVGVGVVFDKILISDTEKYCLSVGADGGVAHTCERTEGLNAERLAVAVENFTGCARDGCSSQKHCRGCHCYFLHK